MKGSVACMVLAATLGFSYPALATQNDPRLDGLFAALKAAPNAQAAAPIEAQIWKLWFDSGVGVLDRLMGIGVTAMGDGEYTTADAAFTALVERAPDFAEGWNRRATLYYLMGRYDRSIADVEKTLSLEPRHFGALSGLGLIRLAQGDEKGALEAFERALAINPNSDAVKFHVRALREKLEGRGT